MTVMVVRFVLKPAVGRHLGAGLSFPSGHVTAVTVTVASLALAVTGGWRIAVVLGGTVVVLATSIAVVSLGWHLGTDVIAGWVIGLGGVTAVDALLKIVGLPSSRVLTRVSFPDRGKSIES